MNISVCVFLTPCIGTRFNPFQEIYLMG